MRATVALLRAVNVGGTGRIAMATLRDLLSGLGLAEVRTVLQSGSAVFLADAEPAVLEARVRVAVDQRLGLVTQVFCRDAEQWRALVAGNPFAEAAARDPSHLLAMVLAEPPPAAAMAGLRAAIAGREEVAALGRTLYLAYPDGIGHSRLTATVIERHLGTGGTARNWATVLKIAAALDAAR